MVKCIVPCRLYGDCAGEYQRDAEYQDDSLATLYPDHFRAVPATEDGEEAPPADGETKRRKR